MPQNWTDTEVSLTEIGKQMKLQGQQPRSAQAAQQAGSQKQAGLFGSMGGKLAEAREEEARARELWQQLYGGNDPAAQQPSEDSSRGGKKGPLPPAPGETSSGQSDDGGKHRT